MVHLLRRDISLRSLLHSVPVLGTGALPERMSEWEADLGFVLVRSSVPHRLLPPPHLSSRTPLIHAFNGEAAKSLFPLKRPQLLRYSLQRTKMVLYLSQVDLDPTSSNSHGMLISCFSQRLALQSIRRCKRTNHILIALSPCEYSSRIREFSKSLNPVVSSHPTVA